MKIKFSFITMFPYIFNFINKYSIIGKKIKENIIKYETIKIENKMGFKKIDNKPIKENNNQLIKINNIVEKIKISLNNNKELKKKKIILLDPSGKKYTQNSSKLLSYYEHIIIICGRYEGIDSRINFFIDESYSIGDYILCGGEVAAILLLESISRHLIIKKENINKESYSNIILENDNYTSPFLFNKYKIPINRINKENKNTKKKNIIEKTKSIRPDLYKKYINIFKRAN